MWERLCIITICIIHCNNQANGRFLSQNENCKYQVNFVLERDVFNSPDIQIKKNTKLSIQSFFSDNFYLSETSMHLHSLNKINVTDVDMVISNQIEMQKSFNSDELNIEEQYKFVFWILPDMDGLKVLFFVILLTIGMIQLVFFVYFFYKKF